MRLAKSPDRRVNRTKAMLREALMALVREKPYDRITVTEILGRANVGRSTFYMHFRDKDELLATGIDDLLAAARAVTPAMPRRNAADHLLRFSLPVLEHVDRHHRAGLGTMGAKGWVVVHGRLRGALTRLLAQEIEEALGARRLRARGIPPDLLARSVASTFVLTLHWWVEHGAKHAVREANDLFRALALPTLQG